MKTNSERLVQIAVAGQVAFARSYGPWEISQAGKAFMYPSVGGISYNVKIGDLASGFQADHAEPGVTISLPGYPCSSKTSHQGFDGWFLFQINSSTYSVQSGRQAASTGAPAFTLRR